MICDLMQYENKVKTIEGTHLLNLLDENTIIKGVLVCLVISLDFE
jgi:hypothetical protein